MVACHPEASGKQATAYLGMTADDAIDLPDDLSVA